MSSLNLQNKRMVKEYYDRLYSADESNIGEILSDYFTDDTSFDCSHPVNHIQGLKEMIEQFWKPFLRAFPDALKHPYILTGATDVNCEGQEPEFKNSNWVCANGYYEATFTEEFLDIPPTGGVVYIRFCECSQIKDGKIVQTYMLLDLLDLLAQAGYVFFNALGNERMIPGPRTFDGVILEESDAEKGSASINLITDMHEDLNTFTDTGYEGFNLETKFKKDFSWYGPYGIGVCKGIEGFQKFHQVPWLNSLPDRMNKDGFANYGENNYAFMGGWHIMSATHLGNDWLGIPATGVEIDMRCIDWWRIEDGRAVENWVNLDIIHMLYQMGIDIFERVRTGRYHFKR